MRVALISDIHGNLIALDAVLVALEAEKVDEVICLGDVAWGGAQPRETLARLRSLGCRIVMGNTDAALLGPPDRSRLPHESDEVAARMDDIDRWCRAQLRAEDLAFVRTFSPVIPRSLSPDITLLCAHGSPRSYDDIIMSGTPPADLDVMLVGVTATVVAGGHTHVPMVRRHRRLILVNPGSAGLPYDQNPWSGEVPVDEVRLAPWAEFGMIMWENGRLDIELRRVPVDVQAIVRAAVRAGRPHSAELARLWGVPVAADDPD